MTIYFCCDERRRAAVLGHPTINGIDFLEVLDDPTLPDDERQRELYVRFINPIDTTNAPLTPENIRFEGGDRIRSIVLEDPGGFTIGTGDDANLLTLRVVEPGDFSTYTLRLVRDPNSDLPPTGYDKLLSAVDFSFKIDCGSDFDCGDEQPCPPDVFDEPDIHYLAKDYASFRQLMLDRMSVLIPDWQERNAADVGIALVEVLAYVGDYLSYYQDAAATEAYLHTARRRVSVRRHARLVDYPMHDGCNARTWVQILVDADAVTVPKGTQLLTRIADFPPTIEGNTADYRRALTFAPEVFETAETVRLYSDHNRILLYTWGEERCCLPRGATRATLREHLPNLKEGDVLIFEEVRGPDTGEPEDANKTHRYTVRLVEVELSEDALGGRFNVPPDDSSTPVTEIRWMAEDALPFPVCVSARISDGSQTTYYEDISVARGNIVLADHGRTLPETEAVGVVPAPRVRIPSLGSNCEEEPDRFVPPRFRPRLLERPVTQAVPYEPLFFSIDADDDMIAQLDGGTLPARVRAAFAARRVFFDTNLIQVKSPGSRWLILDRAKTYIALLEDEHLNVYDPPSASAALSTTPGAALPGIELHNPDDPRPWKPRRDLLNSSADSREFVLETENDGTAYIRFGDDQFGLRPASGTEFAAVYRVGSGRRGNIGSDALAHVVTTDLNITGARNPLPARGGVEPESIERVRQNAPVAFRTQERAVTPEDYARIVGEFPEVQRAAASFRWTGSWYTVYITVDRRNGLPADDEFEERLRQHIERYRMAGHDIEIDAPEFVPLEIELTVCVKPDYFRSQVRAALLEIFSSRVLANGQLGLFHPDNFTFGQTIYLSPLVAAAQNVEGVESVEVTKFGRQDSSSTAARDAGKLVLAGIQIAQLENDPNHPDRGIFRLILEGGK